MDQLSKKLLKPWNLHRITLVCFTLIKNLFRTLLPILSYQLPSNILQITVIWMKLSEMKE